MGKELTNEERSMLKKLTDSTYSILEGCKQNEDSKTEVLYKLAVAINEIDLPEEIKIVYLKNVKELTDSIYSMLEGCKQIGDSRAVVLYKLAVAMNGIDLPEKAKIAFLRGVKRIMDDIHY